MRELFSINPDIRGFESVIIYGAGSAGQLMLLTMLQHNVKVECFADSNPDVCGQRFLNIPVRHIDELSDKRESAVIVSGVYAFSVAEELKKRGFTHIFCDYGNGVRIVHIDREER